MSEVKRWDHHVTWGKCAKIDATMMALRDKGKYVLASDYDALAAENKRLMLSANIAEADKKCADALPVVIAERDHLRTKLAKARELLVMVRQDGWYHPLEEHEIAQIDAALAKLEGKA